MITFYSDSVFLAENSASFLDVIINSSIAGKRQLIDYIEESIMSPYTNDNWDGFIDAMIDLSWLRGKTVRLIHDELPTLPRNELENYLSILSIIDDSWKDVCATETHCDICFHEHLRSKVHVYNEKLC